MEARYVVVRRNQIVVPVLLGLAAAAITVLRLWLGDPRSLTDVLWAEDGYFPSCVRTEGGLECLTQSFAGYFLLVPRTAAILIAPLPLESWPLASVLTAALVTGLCASVVVWSLRDAGLSGRASALGGLTLPLSPLYGLEVIGVVASAYVPLVVAATVIVALTHPVRAASRALIFTFLLVTALTMPSVAVLLLVILIRALARDLGLRVAAEWLAALLVGLFVQALVAFSAPDGRGLSLSRESLRNWVDGVTDSVLSVIPGLSWALVDFTPLFPLRAPWYGPWILVGSALGVSALAVAAAMSSRGRPDRRSLRVALLVLAGLGLSLFPSLAGTFSYRYFVAPVAIWLIAALVLIDPWLTRIRRQTFAACVALMAVLWVPSFAASQVRSSPAPSWSEELTRAASACKTSGFQEVVVVFTPVWPGDNQGRYVDTPVLQCRDLVQ